MPGGSHALDRLNERYDMTVTVEEWPEVWDSIFKAIKTGRALMTGREVGAKGHQLERWALMLKGETVRVLWCPDTRAIVTVLPRSSRNRQGRAKGYKKPKGRQP